MFGTIITWLRGLSAVGKLVVTTATLGTVGIAGSVAQLQVQPAVQQVGELIDSKVEPEVSVVTTKETTETEEIEFQKRTENNPLLEKGVNQLKQAGVVGVKTITYQTTYTDGVETQRAKLKEEITTQPVDEIAYSGTYIAPKPAPAPNCDPNYSGCVPNVSYDLDCADIGFSVTVIGYDKHRFDRDGDGYGCESY